MGLPFNQTGIQTADGVPVGEDNPLPVAVAGGGSGGDASAARQDEQTAYLQSLDGKLPGLEGGRSPVALASLPALSAGSATVGRVDVNNAFALESTQTSGAAKAQVSDGANSAQVLSTAPSSGYGLVVRVVPPLPAAPLAVQLSDGASAYSGARSSQLPANLGQGTAAQSLGVVLASDSKLPSEPSITWAAPAKRDASTSPVTLQAANASRRRVRIQNSVDADLLYVLEGAGTVSDTNYSFVLASGDFAEPEKPSGQVFTGVWKTATGHAMVQEAT